LIITIISTIDISPLTVIRIPAFSHNLLQILGGGSRTTDIVDTVLLKEIGTKHPHQFQKVIGLPHRLWGKPLQIELTINAQLINEPRNISKIYLVFANFLIVNPSELDDDE
jgi:hypothetical protein